LSKAGRSANGKGHYWAIHPANVEDFERGDFRRRRAQRKVRRAMGLSVADDDDDSPIPSPSTTAAVWNQFRGRPEESSDPLEVQPAMDQAAAAVSLPPISRPVTRKRLFDVESLLAPDSPEKPVEIGCRAEPELDLTDSLQRRDGGVSPDRKRRAVSPQVGDVIVDLHRPIRTAADSPNTTSGSVEKPILGLANKPIAFDNVRSPSAETGSGIVSESTSGESGIGMCAAGADMARFWHRHANMASSRLLAKSLFPFPASSYHANYLNDDAERPRDIRQGRGGGQSRIQGQGQICGQNQGQGCEGGQFEGQSVTDFKGLSLTVSPVREKNSMSPVNLN